MQFLVEGFHQSVWVGPKKNINDIPKDTQSLYFEMAEAIGYWIWQCQESVKKDLAQLDSDPISVTFELNREEHFSPIDRNFRRDPQLSNHFIITSETSSLNISIPHTIIPYLYGPDNEGERMLLRYIILGINQLLSKQNQPIISDSRIHGIIESAAPFGLKKKIFILETSDNMLLDPTNLEKYRYVQSYDINVILDSIVPALGALCPPIGDISVKAEKNLLIRNIVMRVLLPKLQTTISQYPNEPLLKRLLGLNESLIQKREDLRINTPTRIACFFSREEQTKDLQESLSKLNKTTIAVRCLIEHLAAEPSSGSKIVSTTGIDELIAIMNEIIDWGSLGDQIEFDLFEIKMGILPSRRIGTEKKLSKEIFDPYYSSKSNENVIDAISAFDQAFPKLNPIEGKEVPESLDKAFTEEFGLSFTRLCEFINDLGIIAYKQMTAYGTISKKDLMVQINKYDHTFSGYEFEKALEYLSLCNRGKVHVVPEGFDGFDISPWRFNRRLSLLRKPLVVINNPIDSENPSIYYGFRQLLSSRTYFYDQCMTNRLKVKEGGPLQKVLGKLAQINGKELVDSVIQVFKKEPLIIDSEVPINPKSELKNETDIGDIDVLLIEVSTKTLYSLECKSMAPSRNIKEMIEEVGKLFGSKSEKGWINKHVERNDWLVGNLELVGNKYKLDLTKFTVKSFFITQEDMLTPYLKTRKLVIPFVTLYTLEEKGLSAFK